MNIILHPSTSKQTALSSAYRKAIQTASELHIATAFLTDWARNFPLNHGCRKIIFLVGTDFGLTRKSACRDVLRWMPKRFASDFLAAPSRSDGGFHPKIVAWKDKTGRCFAIIGSSNLTEAAFNSNYEANVQLRLGLPDYDRIVNWIENIAKEGQVITDEWIEQYNESTLNRTKKGQKNTSVGRVIRLRIPSGPSFAWRWKERRAQQKAFPEIAGKLISAMRQCRNGRLSNLAFWNRFWALWGHHLSRFQGSGLQFTGRSANWRQACKAMLTIIEASKNETQIGLDNIVRQQIDVLAEVHNPVRGAWFTEILCHYLPEQYPLVNRPVNRWLTKNRWRATSGVSEGTRYIELARKLRDAVRQSTKGPRNLAELDAVIWDN